MTSTPPPHLAIISGKNTEAPERVRHFVHYEPDTGQIKHVYSVATFPGAHASTEHDHWRRAQRIAEKHNPDAARLDKVVLEGERPTPRHKIDPGKRRLILA